MTINWTKRFVAVKMNIKRSCYRSKPQGLLLARCVWENWLEP